MNQEKLQYQCVVAESFGQNAFILYLEGREDCLILDPGLDPAKILDSVQSLSREPAAILNTHDTLITLPANETMKKRWPDAPLVIGHGDVHKLQDPVENLSAKYGFNLISPEADVTLKQDDVYEAAGMKFRIWETPGHSIGHIVFIYEAEGHPTVVINGDNLFRMGVGRSDFHDGNWDDLVKSIRMIYTLPDDTIVLTGHGEETTVGFEKANNPFVSGG